LFGEGSAQTCVFRLQFRDLVSHRDKGLLDLFFRKTSHNVRRTVHVPGLDREQDNAFGTRLIALVEQALDQGGVVFDHAGPRPDLDALTSRGVEKEQEGAVVLGEVGERDVLPVAAVVGKSERFVVNDLDEAFRAAAMLNIRRAVSGCGGDKGGILFGDKLRELCRDTIGEALSYAPLVCLRRSRSTCACCTAGVKTRVALFIDVGSGTKIASRCCSR